MKDDKSLVDQYFDYVERVVERTLRGRDAPLADYEDCVTVGYLGFSEALKAFDHAWGVGEQSYLFIKVRGAVVDHLSLLPLPVRITRRMKKQLPDCLKKALCLGKKKLVVERGGGQSKL